MVQHAAGDQDLQFQWQLGSLSPSGAHPRRAAGFQPWIWDRWFQSLEMSTSIKSNWYCKSPPRVFRASKLPRIPQACKCFIARVGILIKQQTCADVAVLDHALNSASRYPGSAGQAFIEIRFVIFIISNWQSKTTPTRACLHLSDPILQSHYHPWSNLISHYQPS